MAEIQSQQSEQPVVVNMITSGKFALFATPSGGVHLTLKIEGEEEERHVEVPKMMLKMMKAKASMFGAENGLV